MRRIEVGKITDAVDELCVRANRALPRDIRRAISSAREREASPVGQHILDTIAENFKIAERDSLPICQDTGMAVVFIDLGMDVHLTGGDFEDAVNEGVRRGYARGYLRKSVVADPLRRVNTNDNTPAVIHTRIVPGDNISITVAPKGFGSENMSALMMFTPSATAGDIEAFLVRAVTEAGANPCPPVIVGMGLGGTAEQAMLLAKRALLRPVGSRNEDGFYASLEARFLDAVNRTGIGPQGLGGSTTALAVHIAPAPTHIAGLPCAVCLGCHATRHASITL